jgi:hypothetical protein
MNGIFPTRWRFQIFWSTVRASSIIRYMATRSSPESPRAVWRSWRGWAHTSSRSNTVVIPASSPIRLL